MTHTTEQMEQAIIARFVNEGRVGITPLPECEELKIEHEEGFKFYVDRIICVADTIWIYSDYDCMSFAEMPDKEQEKIFNYIIK